MMTCLSELEALANAAQGVPTKEKDYAFNSAANPATIKALIALCRLQHATLQLISGSNQALDVRVAKTAYDDAVAAYERFERGN